LSIQIEDMVVYINGLTDSVILIERVENIIRRRLVSARYGHLIPIRFMIIIR